MDFLIATCIECQRDKCKFIYSSYYDNYTSRAIYRCEENKHPIVVFTRNICQSCAFLDYIITDYSSGDYVCTNCGVVQSDSVLDQNYYQNNVNDETIDFKKDIKPCHKYIDHHDRKFDILWEQLPSDIKKNSELYFLYKSNCTKHNLRKQLMIGCIVYLIENEFVNLTRHYDNIALHLNLDSKKLTAYKSKYIDKICKGFDTSQKHVVFDNNIQQQDELFALCINQVKMNNYEACDVLARYKFIDNLPYSHPAIKHCWIGLDGDPSTKYAYCIAEKIGVDQASRFIHMPKSRLEQVYALMKQHID